MGGLRLLKPMGIGGSGYDAPDVILEGPSGVPDSDSGLKGLSESACIWPGSVDVAV